jgi:hypothetical protein
MLFDLFNSAAEQEQGKLYLNAANQLIFSLKGASPILVNPSANFLFRAQFDPANGRATLETWNLDGTGYRVATNGLSSTTAMNMGGTRLTVAASFYTLFHTQGKFDWLRMLDGAVGLSSNGPPGNAVPVGAFELWRYEFEGNGLDSSGTGMHLTLDNAPAFEPTP